MKELHSLPYMSFSPSVRPSVRLGSFGQNALLGFVLPTMQPTEPFHQAAVRVREQRWEATGCSWFVHSRVSAGKQPDSAIV